MRIADLLRLGGANIVTHRKRVVKVVAIVGVLFGVLLMASMLIRGIENTVLAEMSRPMDGEILLGTMVDTQHYEDAQAEEAELMRIREKIRQYGGEVIETESYRMAGMGEVTALPEEVVHVGIEVSLAERPAEAVPMIVPVGTAMSWLKISIPQWISTEQAVAKVQEARERALGQTIELENGQKVYVAGLSSSTAGRSSLALTGVGQELNPLNLVLRVVPLGGSDVFIVDDGEIDFEELIIPDEEPEIPAEVLEQFPELAAPKIGVVWAVFPDLETASKYYYDAENYCEQAHYAYGECEEGYKYAVVSGFNNPFAVTKVFKVVWIVFDWAAVVLTVIGVIIMLATYVRLVGQDAKVVALYRANGATKRQTLAVYIIYLVMLSLLAVVFAVGLGVVLTLMMNWWIGTALTQAFTLGMGVTGRTIILMGVGKWLAITAAVMILVAPVAVMMSAGQFSEKNLARKLK